jgi:hypothetical protein
MLARPAETTLLCGPYMLMNCAGASAGARAHNTAARENTPEKDTGFLLRRSAPTLPVNRRGAAGVFLFCFVAARQTSPVSPEVLLKNSPPWYSQGKRFA